MSAPSAPELIGSRVACVTTYGDVYDGIVNGVDGLHNVSLSDVRIGTTTGTAPVAPTNGAVIGHMFVRGSSILYIDISS